MFQTQTTPPTTRPTTQPPRTTGTRAARAAVLTVGAIALLGLGIGPAAARPDPGSPLEVAAGTTAREVAFVGREADAETRPARCALLRVGTQFVACDFLTGNGVPAPGWIPER